MYKLGTYMFYEGAHSCLDKTWINCGYLYFIHANTMRFMPGQSLDILRTSILKQITYNLGLDKTCI